MNCWTIYHNSQCSKSRATLELLNQAGINPKVIEYLKNPPSAQEISDIINLSQEAPEQFVRKKEVEFESYQETDLSNREKVAEMLHHCPKIMERPIVRKNNQVIIARPPEKVKILLAEI